MHITYKSLGHLFQIHTIATVNQEHSILLFISLEALCNF